MDNISDKKNEENNNDKCKTTPQKTSAEQNKENKNGNSQKTSQFQISSSNKSPINSKTEPPKSTYNYQISSNHNTNVQNVQPFSISSSSQGPQQNLQISSSHQNNNGGKALYVSRRRQYLEISKQNGAHSNTQNLATLFLEIIPSRRKNDPFF